MGSGCDHRRANQDERTPPPFSVSASRIHANLDLGSYAWLAREIELAAHSLGPLAHSDDAPMTGILLRLHDLGIDSETVVAAADPQFSVVISEFPPKPETPTYCIPICRGVV